MRYVFCVHHRPLPGSRANGDQPGPDSLLINGMGHFDCSMATPGAPVNCSEVEKPQMQLNKQRRYRARFVNVG